MFSGDQKLKILIINKFLYPNGGAETYAFKLGDYLRSQGHEIQYFGMEHEGRCVGNAVNAYTTKMDFHGGSIFTKLTYPLKTIYSFEARKKLRLVLEDFKPDVAHLNNINFQLTPSVIYELKKYGVPMVQTVHDVQMSCPCHRFYIEHKGKICEECGTGKFYKCILNRCMHNSFAESIIASIESYYYHFRGTYDLVNRYVCPSRFIASKIVRSGIKKEKIRILYNFSERPSRYIFDSVEKKRYALYFGRFSQEKGVLTLLKLCKELSDITFLIAGRGPLERKVEEICNQLENTQYVGFKSGVELQKMILEAAFSIYPSEWYENCPLSVIESQMLGTPVIGSDLGGTKELIKDGKTGIVYDSSNISNLQTAIIKLWDDEELLRQMQDNCRNISHLNLPEYSERILDIYKSAMEDK